jgi:hypothetical protein
VTLLTIAAVALVVVASLTFNRLVWRRRQAEAKLPADGLKVWELTAPLASLAVLLLVFVLVQTYASWAAAGRAETDEATATLLLFREADLVRDARLRATLHKQVVCYATSVIRQEWPAMADSRLSNVPTYWGAVIRGAGVRLVRDRTDRIAGENLVQRDSERATARQNRLGEARPTVPTPLSWLMLAALAFTVAILGTATLVSVGRYVHVVIVVAAAVVFTSALILVRELDQPYAGSVRREPTQTIFLRGLMAAELRGSLPCDAEGLPVGVPGFRARTTPLG